MAVRDAVETLTEAVRDLPADEGALVGALLERAAGMSDAELEAASAAGDGAKGPVITPSGTESD